MADQPSETTQEVAEEKQDSNSLLKMKELHRVNPSAFMRRGNIYNFRMVLDRPEMTWEEFCNLKIQAFADHWQGMKATPFARGTGVTRVPTDEQLKKMEEQEAKALARLKALQDKINIGKRLREKTNAGSNNKPAQKGTGKKRRT